MMPPLQMEYEMTKSEWCLAFSTRPVRPRWVANQQM